MPETPQEASGLSYSETLDTSPRCINFLTPPCTRRKNIDYEDDFSTPCAKDRSNPTFSNNALDNTSYSINHLSRCVQIISTPDVSDICNITVNRMGVDPSADADTSEPSNTSTDIGDHSNGNEMADTNITILNEIRKKYVNNLVIGHLNINSFANKFEALKVIIVGKLDILVLVETKLDDSFPERQFIIEGL